MKTRRLKIEVDVADEPGWTTCVAAVPHKGGTLYVIAHVREELLERAPEAVAAEIACALKEGRERHARVGWRRAGQGNVAHAVDLETGRCYCGAWIQLAAAVKASAEIPSCATCVKVARGTRSKE